MITINTQDLLSLQPNIDRLEEKKNLLDTKRPLPYSVLEKVRHQLSIEWTYHSNSIEGNTLTENETQMVLLDGTTVKGKSLREHFEVFNHDRALKQLYELVHADYQINVRDILCIHELVLRSIEDYAAGRFRTGSVRIVGANFVPPAAHKVPDLMEELISFVNENPYQLSDIMLATLFHHQFVHIHPFADGNGRTVRLIMNALLLKKGFPPAIILKPDRKKYYEALNAANRGNYNKLGLLMLQAADRSLSIYLNSIDVEADDVYLPISDIAKEPAVPYGSEYISLLARQGKIDAYKEGKDWYTSKKSVLGYITHKTESKKKL
jgi:Fic family protein